MSFEFQRRGQAGRDLMSLTGAVQWVAVCGTQHTDLHESPTLYGATFLETVLQCVYLA